MSRQRDRDAIGTPIWAIAIAATLAALLGWWASAPPPVRGGGTGFSVQRAMGDVTALFSVPHATGTAAQAETRARLVARMRGLGLEVSERQGRGGHGEGARFSGGDVVNIAGILPGRDRRAPALLLMAHYDTVPSSPGAGDDGFGIATMLEVARLMGKGIVPQRDVILLMTDGEEAGLLGARAFFGGDPLARRVGVAINMDTRGDAGRAIMYETGPMPGDLVRLYARAVPHPTTDSVAAFVRRSMRNSSDFAVAAAAGVPGLNFAVTGDQFDYHAATSTPATIDRRSLQHFGDQVTELAFALARAPTLPAPTAEPAYASLLGLVTLVWPYWAGWIVLAVALVAGGAAILRERPGSVALAKALGWAVLATLGAALCFWAMRGLTGVPDGFTGVRPLLARWTLYEGGILAAGLGFALLAARGGGTGPFLLAALAAVAIQALAPAAAAAPLVALTGGAVVLALRRWPVIAAIVAGIAVAQLAATAHLILLAVGDTLPAAAAWFVLLAAVPLAPLAPRRATAIGGGLVLAGLVAVVAIRLLPVGMPERPRPSQAFHIAEPVAGRAWRGSTLPVIDGWTAAAIGPGAVRRPLSPAFVGRDYADGVMMAPTPILPVAVPQVRSLSGPGGEHRIVVTPPPAADTIAVALTGSGRIVSVGGVPFAAALDPRRETVLRWSAPRGPLVIAWRGTIATGRVATFAEGWPAGAAPRPARPADAMPWYRDGATIVLLPFAARWPDR